MNKIFFNILFIFSLSTFCLTEASFDGSQVDLNVNYCNNDNICNLILEDFSSCPLDCPATCNNNNMCESETGENLSNCPADCTVIPPVLPLTPSQSGSYVGINENFFSKLTVEVDSSKAIIKWESSTPSMATVKWGTTPEYKDGIIRNINFLLNHKIEITNLVDGTVYYFNIQSEDFFRKIKSIENQTFRTLFLPDTTPASNPMNVLISRNLSGVVVSWDNPVEQDFDYIRVVKNKNKYTKSPFVGDLVYEGRGEYFFDIDIKENDKYFYSLFSRDRAGNYSSGSFVDIVYNPPSGYNQEVISPNEGKSENIKEPKEDFSVKKERKIDESPLYTRPAILSIAVLSLGPILFLLLRLFKFFI